MWITYHVSTVQNGNKLTKKKTRTEQTIKSFTKQNCITHTPENKNEINPWWKTILFSRLHTIFDNMNADLCKASYYNAQQPDLMHDNSHRTAQYW